jgi:hypothetical protein
VGLSGTQWHTRVLAGAQDLDWDSSQGWGTKTSWYMGLILLGSWLKHKGIKKRKASDGDEGET